VQLQKKGIARNYSMDGLRTLATLLVILLHVSSTYVIRTAESQVYDRSFWIANVLDSLSRICVPLFVMISGRYLLGRNEPTIASYKKRASRIILPIVAWTLIYISYRAALGYLTQKELGLGPILKDAILGIPFYHMWFLFMIIGLYAIAPLLNRLIQNASRNNLWIVTVIFLTFGFLNIAYDSIFGNRPIFILWFLNYLGYFLLGFLMKDAVKRISPLVLLLVFVISSLVTAVLSYFTAKFYHNFFFYSFLSPLVILASLSIYQLFSQTDMPANSFSRIAHLTLGIYLVHAGILDVLVRVFDSLRITFEYNVLLMILLEFALVAVISLALAFLFSKIKYLRKII
jgi:surface polysaccharide O-acyltransferase-like enzyme